jgi:Transcriptional regulators containing a DNA-binding HTH domain and an aminotransferase domain (MocR family) and their eukaryotic orthologs
MDLRALAHIDARHPDPAEVLITSGASQALDLLCTLMTAPGDTVLVESPTYHLAVRILRDHPLHLVAVPSDADGIDVEALTTILKQLAKRGRRARMLYFVPTYHNPTGVCLSVERRRALATIAAEHGFVLIEDDVYRELSYDAPAPPSVWSIAPPGTVVRIASFSKSLAPGLRLGYLTADASLTRRLIGSGVLDSGGGLNPFTALTVAEVCAAGDFEATVTRLRAMYRERRDALAQSCARICHLDAASPCRAADSFSGWNCQKGSMLQPCCHALNRLASPTFPDHASISMQRDPTRCVSHSACIHRIN